MIRNDVVIGDDLRVARERQQVLDELVLLERSLPPVGNPHYREFQLQRAYDELRDLTVLVADELEGFPVLQRR